MNHTILKAFLILMIAFSIDSGFAASETFAAQTSSAKFTSEQRGSVFYGHRHRRCVRRHRRLRYYRHPWRWRY